MRRLVCCLLQLTFFSTALAAQVYAGTSGPLFTYKGKPYAVKDLGPAMQQMHYDLESENAQRMQAFVDQAVLNLYFDEEAKKAGKDRKAIEEQKLAVKDPSDKDVKDWYEANKARIPPNYQLDQIKDDIKQILKGEQRKKQRDALLQDIKKNLVFDPPKLEAPQFQIATDGFPVKGKPDAKVTIVEFADYQCPHCKEAMGDLAKVMAKYEGKVKLVFLDFPINPSGVSLAVAHGAYCAKEQQKFWEYHEKAYQDQATLDKNSPEKLANDLKLDVAKFKACLATKDPDANVQKAKAEGERIGVNGTPAIFVNGKRVSNHSVPEMSKEIDAALKGSA